jgi:hypothetical protein
VLSFLKENYLNYFSWTVAELPYMPSGKIWGRSSKPFRARPERFELPTPRRPTLLIGLALINISKRIDKPAEFSKFKMEMWTGARRACSPDEIAAIDAIAFPHADFTKLGVGRLKTLRMTEDNVLAIDDTLGCDQDLSISGRPYGTANGRRIVDTDVEAGPLEDRTYFDAKSSDKFSVAWAKKVEQAGRVGVPACERRHSSSCSQQAPGDQYFFHAG